MNFLSKIYKNLVKGLLGILFLICIFTLITYGRRNIGLDSFTCAEEFKGDMYFKGFKDAVDFTYNEDNTYFIAYKNKIQILNEKGYSEVLLKNNNLNITSIEYKDDKLYYVSGTKVYYYDLKNKQQKNIIKDIPNYGDYRKSLLKVKGNYLYVSIGSATNSGVVGEDNKWIEQYSHNHDITPKALTIKGDNFGDEKTGAFVPYKTQNIKGQILTSSFPGNSSIIIYNLKTRAMETFAWGIRNIKGLDFNSKEKLFGVVGGMENRGLRPVKGDCDYIFRIDKNIWYGWPDYSGGDPINSPRFKNKNGGRIPFILANHPSTNPPGPYYQHKKLNSLGTLAIDKDAILKEKDSIYFYEINDNIIYKINKSNVTKPVVKLPKDSMICSIKFCSNKLLALDKKKGILYKVENK